MDLYDYLRLVPTVDFFELGRAADSLMEDDRVREQLRNVLIEHLLYQVELERATTGNASPYYQDTYEIDEKIDRLLRPVVKRLIEEHATLQPEYCTDSDDPRNQRIIHENVLRAVRLNNTIERMVP